MQRSLVRRTWKRWRGIACALLCLAAVQGPAAAGQATGDITPDTALDSNTVGKGQSLDFFNDPDFLVVPIPMSNPTLGSGGALAAAVLFKADDKSSSSFIGAAGFGTSNGSWGGGAAANLNFGEDLYRAKLSAGYANVLYNFYGIGSAAADAGRFVSLTQSGYLVQALFQVRVAPHFYLGGQSRTMNIKTAFDLPGLAGELLANGGPLSKIDNRITTFGLVATYDSRNKDYSPDDGELIEGAIDFGLQKFIFNNSFTRATASYSRYDRLDDDLVLASHAALCNAAGKVPIFDLCLFGMGNDLRGYAVGQFQDKAMFATQAELRWHAFWRIGLVAFAGIGSVAPTLDKFENILVAGGGGIRFVVSQDYGINLGVDGAVNKAGEGSFYIQVGEAF